MAFTNRFGPELRAVRVELRPDERAFELDSGRLCLDLVATVGERWRRSFERIVGPGDLGRWLDVAGLAVVGGAAPDQPDVRATRRLRAAIYRVVDAAVDGRALPRREVGTLNRCAAAPTPVPRLDPITATRSLVGVGLGVDAALAVIARDAIELVAGAEVARIRECAATRLLAHLLRRFRRRDSSVVLDAHLREPREGPRAPGEVGAVSDARALPRVGVLILPEHRWSDAAARWRSAESLGFDHAWTFDHLTWRSFRDEPWFGAVPTLTAAAAVTSTIRLGTLVATPNFRHPVPFAKEVVTLDDIAGGRLTLGLGAGGPGWDATVLGHPEWASTERADASRSSSRSSTSSSVSRRRRSPVASTRRTKRAPIPGVCSSRACRSPSPRRGEGACGWRPPSRAHG